MSYQTLNYLDLMSQITCDTLLSVKYQKPNGSTTFCKYWIPQFRKDNTPILFGEIYAYFSSKEGFIMGLGYIGHIDITGEWYEGQTQYFGFTKAQPPHERFKQLDNALILKRGISYLKEK